MGWRNRVNALVVRGGVVVWAQAAQPTSPTGDEAAAQTATSCVQPPPLVGWQDYIAGLNNCVPSWQPTWRRRGCSEWRL
jgi:hypothetical protein